MMLGISVSGCVQILPALHLGKPASKVSTVCQIWMHAHKQSSVFLKFSLLYTPFNGFFEKSNIRQGNKLVAEKLFCKDIYLLLAFEFLLCDF
jgi:hypothetical protein